MNITEKLQKIKTKCQRLLALAKKRTPGKWLWDGDASNTSNAFRESAAPWLVAGDISGPAVISGDVICMKPNDEFIAACAGPSEAGWRATIAAIDAIFLMLPQNENGWVHSYIRENDHAQEAEHLASVILDAWEGIV